MRPHLSIVTLGVDNLDRSRAFYQALGWDVGSPDDPITFIALGGVTLALFPRDRLAEDATVPSAGSGFRGFTLAHNEPSIEAVDAAFAEALAAGAALVKSPRTAEWGGYSGYVSDPDGFLWEIAYDPFADPA